jgi:hypothetical protein
MNWKWKAAIVSAVIILFAILLFIIKRQQDQISKQEAIEKSVIDMKQLADQIVRNHSEYMTKADMLEFAKKNGVDLGPIQDDIKKLGADITSISVAVSKTSGYSGQDIQSTSTTPGHDVKPNQVTCPDGAIKNCPDPYGHLSNQAHLALNEPFDDKTSVPWGSAGFSAWEEKPWQLNVYPRQYKTNTIVATDKNGRQIVYSQLQIDTEGKTYKIPIADAQMVQQYPEASFHWWSPALYLGVDGGITMNPFGGEFIQNLQLSVLSYGKTTINPQWTFLGLGLGYEAHNQNVAFVLSPVNYNIGSWITILHNTYVGPTFALDPSGRFSVLLGVRVGL